MSTFLAVNRNKRSLCVDLKSEGGRRAFQDAVRHSDVVIQNFRRSTAERLGLDHPTLAAINPRIIVCSISGYGDEGPYRLRPGQDLVLQGYSGSMFAVGKEGDPPDAERPVGGRRDVRLPGRHRHPRRRRGPPPHRPWPARRDRHAHVRARLPAAGAGDLPQHRLEAPAHRRDLGPRGDPGALRRVPHQRRLADAGDVPPAGARRRPRRRLAALARRLQRRPRAPRRDLPTAHAGLPRPHDRRVDRPARPPRRVVRAGVRLRRPRRRRPRQRPPARSSSNPTPTSARCARCARRSGCRTPRRRSRVGAPRLGADTAAVLVDVAGYDDAQVADLVDVGAVRVADTVAESV